MAWLSGWTDRAKLTIKGGGGITSDITDFPLTIKLTSSSGKTGTDMSRIFEKLAYSTNDDFTGVDGDQANTDLWQTNESTNFEAKINSNKLLLRNTVSSQGSANVKSRFLISGDFDIEAHFSSLSLNTSMATAQFYLTGVDTNYNFVMFRRYSTNHGNYIGTNYYSGGWGTENRYTSSATDVKLRITRSGSTVNYYRNVGSGWVLQDTRSSVYTGDIAVRPGIMQSESNGLLSANVDDFIINSGDVVWPPKTYPYRKKIAITSDDGVTMLPTEIHYWDVANKVIVLWTKVPTISAGTDTILYLYYDKTQIDNVNVGDVGETVAQSVWSGNSGKYQAVYHMSEYPTGSIKDSTNNLNDLSSAGSMTIYDLVNSNTLGYALDFDGSNDYLSLTSSKADVLMDRVDSANAISISCWVEHRDTSSDRIFQYGVTGDPETELNCSVANNLQVFYEYGGGTNYGVGSPSMTNPTELHHVYFTIDSNYTKIYLDGEIFFTTAAASSFWSNYTARDLIIGAADSTPSSNYFNGKLFEYHIANAMHTADYVKLSYLAESDNLITYEQYLGYVSGYVYIENTVTSGVDVYLYSREDGNYIGQTTSSGDGYFIIPTTCTGSHFVVALDKEESPTYNDIIKGRIPPHLIT